MSSASVWSRTLRRMKFPSFERSRRTVAVMTLSRSGPRWIINAGFAGSMPLKTFQRQEYCDARILGIHGSMTIAFRNVFSESTALLRLSMMRRSSAADMTLTLTRCHSLTGVVSGPGSK